MISSTSQSPRLSEDSIPSSLSPSRKDLPSRPVFKTRYVHANFLYHVPDVQLEMAFAAYNKDTKTLDQLKIAFEAAKNASCTENEVYQDVDSLFKMTEEALSDFTGEADINDTIIFKIWDMGGQQVCFCMLHHHFNTHYVSHHCNAITPCANLHWCLSPK